MRSPIDRCVRRLKIYSLCASRPRDSPPAGSSLLSGNYS